MWIYITSMRQEEEKYKKSNYEYEIRLKVLKEFKELISLYHCQHKATTARRVELADGEML